MHWRAACRTPTREQSAYRLANISCTLKVAPYRAQDSQDLPTISSGSNAKRYGWSRRVRRDRMVLVREHLTVFRAAILKTATFVFYTRLFSLWHHLHLPLFVVLIMAAILHVVAVHLY